MNIVDPHFEALEISMHFARERMLQAPISYFLPFHAQTINALPAFNEISR
ncbi:MAG: hypothetical protein V3V61_04740 [Gammaproteobacteria bacterium]